MTTTPERILVVDDEEYMLALFDSTLGKEGYTVVGVASGEEALQRLKTDEFDLVISDLVLPGIDGLDLFHQVKTLQAELPYILMTGHGTVQSAVAAMKEGATDYLTKPIELEELKVVVHKALELHRLTREVERLRAQVDHNHVFPDIIGRSKAIQALLKQVRLVAQSDSTVLLQGESGTGKELIARAIHTYSPRKERPFVTLDCGTVSESLLESELFGYLKGAFTGATTDKKGLCEEAHRGTLFLDEIGDVAPAFQTKLLRLLQTGEIRPVGSTKTMTVDVRIVAATNKDLRHEVQEQRFRKDLYYRLAVVPLAVPPLRERREDIPLLVSHFLTQYSQRSGQPAKQIQPTALQRLMDAPWPGNIRELEHTIERAVVLSPAAEISPDSLVLEPIISAAQTTPGLESIEQARAVLNNVERDKLRTALVQVEGNRSRAAKLLGISRSTFYEKIKRYGLTEKQ